MGFTRTATIYVAASLIAGCLLSVMSGLSAQTDSARITGTVRDQAGAALPGVEVTATAAQQRRQTISDSAGRFELTNLQPGLYVVTTELAGFKSARREVTLTASGSVTADLSLRIGCVAEVLYVVFDGPELWKQSSLVAHVRIKDRSEPIHSEDDCEGHSSYRYTATVIRELRQPSFPAATERSMVVSADVELLPQHEYVVWLEWQPDRRAFRLAYNADTALAAQVTNGRLEWRGHYVPPAGVAPRTTVDELFATIAAWRRSSITK